MSLEIFLQPYLHCPLNAPTRASAISFQHFGAEAISCSDVRGATIQTLLLICVAKHSTGGEILIVLLVFSDVRFSRLMESEYSPAQLKAWHRTRAQLVTNLNFSG
jgi:hypothetical protein